MCITLWCVVVIYLFDVSYKINYQFNTTHHNSITLDLVLFGFCILFTNKKKIVENEVNALTIVCSDNLIE